MTLMYICKLSNWTDFSEFEKSNVLLIDLEQKELIEKVSSIKAIQQQNITKINSALQVTNSLDNSSITVIS